MINETIWLDAQFYDLDPMAVVWHGNYARFFEQARSALLDKIGYNYAEMRDSGLMWPIVDMRIKYVASIRFPQRFAVTAALKEYENRIKIDYLVHDNDNKVFTKASTVQVAVDVVTGDLMLVSPQILIEKVHKCLSAGSLQPSS